MQGKARQKENRYNWRVRLIHYFMTRNWNDKDIRITKESFENVAKAKQLGTTLISQKDIQDEIKNRLNSGNVCYHSVQNFFFPSHIKKPKH
jgi:hypothetical protein